MKVLLVNPTSITMNINLV